MKFREIVEKNRSYRGFDEGYKFTKEQLEEYVDLTIYTASSVNAQPLKYYLVYTDEEVELVRPMTRWARALPDMELPHKNHHATAFIIICQDTSISDNLARYQKDIGIVAQTILLAAVEEGLGGCMIGNFTASEVKEKLNLDESLVPMLIVALGKPDEEIVITEIKDNQTNYYRDESDIHYVPKRSLKDIII